MQILARMVENTVNYGFTRFTELRRNPRTRSPKQLLIAHPTIKSSRSDQVNICCAWSHCGRSTSTKKNRCQGRISAFNQCHRLCFQSKLLRSVSVLLCFFKFQIAKQHAHSADMPVVVNTEIRTYSDDCVKERSIFALYTQSFLVFRYKS